MSITLNTLVYSEDAALNPNMVRHTGPDASFQSKDYIDLSRTAPKPSANSAGVARARVKRTKTVTLADASTADAIITVDFTFPVGMAEADADALRDDVGDYLISTDAKDLSWKHDIRQ